MSQNCRAVAFDRKTVGHESDAAPGGNTGAHFENNAMEAFTFAQSPLAYAISLDNSEKLAKKRF
jgi:hypothetical protein